MTDLSVLFRGDGWMFPAPFQLGYPDEVITVGADRPQDLASLLSRLDRIAASGDHDVIAAGYLSYEAGVFLEGSVTAFRPPDEGPLALFGVFEMSGGRPFVDAAAEARSAPETRIAGSSLEEEEWRRGIGRIRNAIQCGDVYQVNLTRRVTAEGSVSPAGLAAAMWADNPVPYAVLLSTPAFSVVSNSPELFLEVDLGAGTARSGPIKGTIARSGGSAGDAAAIESLLRSEKDAAEHLMIVDLVRNDLGRVAVPGGVGVPRFRALKTLSHLHHIESIVEAKLRPDAAISDLLLATLPPGSVTGAPKRATLGFIRAIEPVTRGPYCGCAGYVRGDGTAVLNVSIRTAVVTPDKIVYHTGGGIVWDSEAGAEWQETVTKSIEFFRGIGLDSGAR